MWAAEVDIERREGFLKKTVVIVVASDDIESLKCNATVIKRALKYSGYTPSLIADLGKWKIKNIVIIKKLGLV
jgi:hypothetical protein